MFIFYINDYNDVFMKEGLFQREESEEWSSQQNKVLHHI